MSLREADPFEQWARAFAEPIVIVSRDGIVEWANPAAAVLTGGWPPIVGAKLHALVRDDEKTVEAYLHRCSWTSSATIGSLSVGGSDGPIVRWRCEGFALRQASAPSSARQIVLRLRTEQSASERFGLLNRKIDELSREIRQRKQIECEHAELVLRERLARDGAERANRLKDEFLATLSHELRTPLSAILGWVYLMRADSQHSDPLRRGLETIERNARLQSQLIDDLLDLSRITSGKVRLNVQMVDLVQMLEEARDSILPASGAKQVKIVTVFDAEAKVSGDPDRLRQIVWNLLSNAVKFTPKGGTVQLRLKRIDSQLEIVVSDNGQGIPRDVLPYVFERFRQGDSSSTRKHGGLGLGLAIVRYMTELHGGRVGVESDGEGRGATFTVCLPVAPVHKGALFADSGAEVPVVLIREDAVRLDSLRILVVEDDADSREMLHTLLEKSGAAVEAVASASEGLRAAQQRPPDLILSDIEMPEEDGYFFIRRFREGEAGRARFTPAIALTAYARPEDRVRALRSGFQMHLAKPVNPPDLIAAILRTVNASGSNGEGAKA